MEMQLFINLGIALAVGLLIGVERGWQERAASEGYRIAGIRTFGLLGLLGGLWALLAETVGVVLLGFGIVTLAIIMMTAYATDKRVERSYGITTVVAALIAFVLGMLAVQGYSHVAVMAAVVTTVLLSLKPVLHSWLQKLEETELFASLKLLIISVVLLPVLPNQGYGPWQAFNPYLIWWMVVLIAAISFVGYFVMKVAGLRKGVILTSVLGGMVSSIALTLYLSRLGKQKSIHPILSIGVLIASATMFPRMLLEVAVVNYQLLTHLLLPMSMMMVAAYGYAFMIWRRSSKEENTLEPAMRNPFELLPAVRFGLLLALVMLMSNALYDWYGSAGIYALSMISGMADVDAITLSLSSMAETSLDQVTASRAILVAGMTNTVVKGAMVFIIAGGRLGLKVFPGIAIVVAVGILGILFL